MANEINNKKIMRYKEMITRGLLGKSTSDIENHLNKLVEKKAITQQEKLIILSEEN